MKKEGLWTIVRLIQKNRSRIELYLNQTNPLQIQFKFSLGALLPWSGHSPERKSSEYKAFNTKWLDSHFSEKKNLLCCESLSEEKIFVRHNA